MTDFNDLQPVVCVTHVDLDGHASAACVLKKYPHAKVYYSNYGRSVPDAAFVRGCKMFVTDYTLAEFEMQRCKTLGIEVIWIDHHKSNIEKLRAAGYSAPGLQSEERCGAYLTHKFLFPNAPIPRAIEIVDDYDRWQFKLPETKIFQAGSSMFETRPNMKSSFIWKELLESTEEVAKIRIDIICRIGNELLEFNRKRFQIFCDDLAYRCVIDGANFLVANTKQANSTFFDSADKTGINALSVIQFSPDIKKYRCSIYSPDDRQEVIQFAQSRGGGGHPKACGFQSIDYPFPVGNSDPSPMAETIQKYQTILEARKSAIVAQASAHSDKISLMASTFRELFLGHTCMCINHPYITELLRSIPTSIDVIDTITGTPLKAFVGFTMTKTGWYRVGVYFFNHPQPTLEEGIRSVPKMFSDARDFYEEKTPYGNVYWFYTRQLPVQLPVY